MIKPGSYEVPPGHLALVVTFLELSAPPLPRSAPMPEGAEIVPWTPKGLDAYRNMMRLIGTHWLWVNRLRLSDAALAEAIGAPGVEMFRMARGEEVLGFLEMKFAGEICDIAFFGVVQDAIGTTAARCLMTFALDRAFARDIRRVRLNTCTLDHPGALAFYRRTGFTEIRRAVEIIPDPRLDGTLPRDAAPQVAILE